MSFFDDSLVGETLAGVRTKIEGYAAAAGLVITDWLVGAVGQQILESVVELVYGESASSATIVRGYASLDTSTDPGDDDAFDPNNATLAPAPGFLSNLGLNVYGTTREESTFATGSVTFANAGTIARTFAPFGLSFAQTGAPTPAPTYRNAPDATIYTNPDGTVTVGANTSIVLPIIADVIGTGSNAPPNSIAMTTVLNGCSVTSASAILGSDREAADLYRTRCRQAPSRLSFSGPEAAYAYYAAKNVDGTPLINGSGNPSAITRVQVTQESSTGIVNVYYANAAGAAGTDDRDAANTNIRQNFIVPDAITFTGAVATATSIHVVGSAKRRGGISAATAKQNIINALTAYFTTIPVAGFDQTSGSGKVYVADLQAAASQAANVYDVVITTPGGDTTLAVGHVATLNSVAGDWTVP